MLNEFFINSLVDNLKLLEKQSIKLKDDKIISQNNMSKEEINFINNKLNNDIELLSNLNRNKINDNDLNIFVYSLEFKKLEKNINNIFTLLNNDISFYDNKIKKTSTKDNDKSYDFLSNKLIKDEIKRMEINQCLKDINLFKNKNKEIDNLVKLIDLKDLGLLSSQKIVSKINTNNLDDNNYTTNEIKLMSEMSKYIISDAFNEEMEAMENILVSGRFTSSTEQQLLKKAGYTESFNQYLRGTNSINGIAQTTPISKSYYRSVGNQSCHSNCHSDCHGARGWR